MRTVDAQSVPGAVLAGADEPTECYVLARFLWPMLAGLRVLGLPADQHVRDAGLSMADLMLGNGRVPLASALNLCQAAIEYAGRDTLGLELAQLYELGGFGLLDFLAQSCSTLGEAIERMCSCEPVHQTVLATDLHLEGDRAVLTQRYKSGVTVPRFVSENNLANLVVIGRKFVGGELPLREIAFTAAAPADATLHRALFRCPIVWDAPSDRMVLAASALSLRNVRADAGLAELLYEHASSLLQARSEMDTPVSCKVRELAKCAGQRILTMAEAAKVLGISERTLQRHLRKEGTSFAELIDEARHLRAKRLLSVNHHSDADIAERLGFSEPRAFRRAFKRWCGETPQEFRMATAARLSEASQPREARPIDATSRLAGP